MEEFKTDVFVITAFKSIKEPCDTFRTDVFVIDALIVMTVAVDALKSETFDVSDKIALLIKLFTHDVVGMLEELSTIDRTDDIFGFIKKAVGVFMVKPEDRFPEPIVTFPVVKLEPIFNSDVSDIEVISFA